MIMNNGNQNKVTTCKSLRKYNDKEATNNKDLIKWEHRIIKPQCRVKTGIKIASRIGAIITKTKADISHHRKDFKIMIRGTSEGTDLPRISTKGIKLNRVISNRDNLPEVHNFKEGQEKVEGFNQGTSNLPIKTGVVKGDPSFRDKTNTGHRNKVVDLDLVASSSNQDKMGKIKDKHKHHHRHQGLP
jgi:hypothetical protein